MRSQTEHKPTGLAGPILFLISSAIFMKVCWTFVELRAEVSRNGIPKTSACSWNWKEIVKLHRTRC